MRRAIAIGAVVLGSAGLVWWAALADDREATVLVLLVAVLMIVRGTSELLKLAGHRAPITALQLQAVLFFVVTVGAGLAGFLFVIGAIGDHSDNQVIGGLMGMGAGALGVYFVWRNAEFIRDGHYPPRSERS